MSTEKQDPKVDVPWHPLVVDHGFYSPLMSGSIDGTDSTPHDKAIRRGLEANCRPWRRVIIQQIKNNDFRLQIELTKQYKVIRRRRYLLLG